MPATKPKRKDRKDDEYRWRATTHTRRKQWRKWENVGLKPTLELHHLDLRWVAPGIPGLDILGAASDTALERTIDGPSTLTIQVKDPWRTLFRKGAHGPDVHQAADASPASGAQERKLAPVDVDEGWNPNQPTVPARAQRQGELDGATFRLVKVTYNHADEAATLTFEDTRVPAKAQVRRTARAAEEGNPRPVHPERSCVSEVDEATVHLSGGTDRSSPLTSRTPPATPAAPRPPAAVAATQASAPTRH